MEMLDDCLQCKSYLNFHTLLYIYAIAVNLHIGLVLHK